MMWVQLFLAFLVSSALAAWQYLHKKNDYKLFIIRTLVYFLILLLWINPKINKQHKQKFLPDLYILTDQSQSIEYIHETFRVKKIIQSLKKSDLEKKFHLHFLGFHSGLFPLDSLNFKGQRTDIAQALQGIKEIYNQKNTAPVILISDGNANQGQDYSFAINKQDKLQVFPIILGDTTHYENIYIERINVNPIVFKGNKFPVEIFINYDGNRKINSNLKIYDGKKLVYHENFHPEKNNLIKTVHLKANTSGVHHYTARVGTLKNEKNIIDNKKYFSLEVIDQSKKIAIISSIIHPDIGALNRIFQKNKYYQTDIIDLNKNHPNLSKYDALVLYQPDKNFKQLFKQNKLSKSNWFIITGPHTDWKWLNSENLFFKKAISTSIEEYFPWANKDFNLFKLPEISYEKLPPLRDFYGQLKYKNVQSALFSKIKGISTQQGLLLVNMQPKQVLLAGENLWQWALFAGKNHEKEKITELFQKIIQYISLHKNFDKIQIQYKKTYYLGEAIDISTVILNENLENNPKAKPLIEIYAKNKFLKKLPFIQDEKGFHLNLKSLPPDEYFFKVRDKSTMIHTQGSFVVLDKSPEAYKSRPDVEALEVLSKNTQGKIYFPENYQKLINNLLQKNKYPAHFKMISKTIPLIDYRWLLFLIVLLLSTEWFLKKLQGQL